MICFLLMTEYTSYAEVQFILRLGTMTLLKKHRIIAVIFLFAALFCHAASLAQSQSNQSAMNQSIGREMPVPFLYPDPRTVGVVPYQIQGKQPGPVTSNRYAGVTEQERFLRELQEHCVEQQLCPLCEEEYKTPCGACKMCLAGFPCERTLCRHCVQPRSKNMGSSCDLTAGGEPCGTCDACREHRSDPCEHADDGYGPRGEFNPYHEPRLLSVIPRPILDTYNNGARKFPVYYNPAPYYRPTWNPSMFAGYARPFTFRWSCSHCYKNPCICSTPGLAGQVPYAYTCKFCKRNPCACAQDICDANKLMDPKGIAEALAAERAEAAGGQGQGNTGRPAESTTERGGVSLPAGTDGSGGISVEGLLDDTPTPSLPSPSQPSSGQNVPRYPRPFLDSPAPQASPALGSGTVS